MRMQCSRYTMPSLHTWREGHGVKRLHLRRGRGLVRWRRRTGWRRWLVPVWQWRLWSCRKRIRVRRPAGPRGKRLLRQGRGKLPGAESRPHRRQRVARPAGLQARRPQARLCRAKRRWASSGTRDRELGGWQGRCWLRRGGRCSCTLSQRSGGDRTRRSRLPSHQLQRDALHSWLVKNASL